MKTFEKRKRFSKKKRCGTRKRKWSQKGGERDIITYDEYMTTKDSLEDSGDKVTIIKVETFDILFENDNNIQFVTWVKNDTDIENIVLPDNCKFCVVIIKDSLLSVAVHAFANCSSLVEVHLPEGIKKIGKEAFLNCTKLSTIELPDSIVSVGVRAFANCSSLLYFTSSPTVTIANDAFVDCNSIFIRAMSYIYAHNQNILQDIKVYDRFLKDLHSIQYLQNEDLLENPTILIPVRYLDFYKNYIYNILYNNNDNLLLYFRRENKNLYIERNGILENYEYFEMDTRDNTKLNNSISILHNKKKKLEQLLIKSTKRVIR